MEKNWLDCANKELFMVSCKDWYLISSHRVVIRKYQYSGSKAQQFAICRGQNAWCMQGNLLVSALLGKLVCSVTQVGHVQRRMGGPTSCSARGRTSGQS